MVAKSGTKGSKGWDHPWQRVGLTGQGLGLTEAKGGTRSGKGKD